MPADRGRPRSELPVRSPNTEAVVAIDVPARGTPRRAPTPAGAARRGTTDFPSTLRALSSSNGSSHDSRKQDPSGRPHDQDALEPPRPRPQLPPRADSRPARARLTVGPAEHRDPPGIDPAPLLPEPRRRVQPRLGPLERHGAEPGSVQLHHPGRPHRHRERARSDPDRAPAHERPVGADLPVFGPVPEPGHRPVGPHRRARPGVWVLADPLQHHPGVGRADRDEVPGGRPLPALSQRAVRRLVPRRVAEQVDEEHPQLRALPADLPQGRARQGDRARRHAQRPRSPTAASRASDSSRSTCTTGETTAGRPTRPRRWRGPTSSTSDRSATGSTIRSRTGRRSPTTPA